MPKSKKKKKHDSGPAGAPKRDFTDEELRQSRPPHWAKGKMIGMWHRAKNAKKKGAPTKGEASTTTNGDNKKEFKAEIVPVEIPADKLEQISRSLSRIGVPTPPSIQSQGNTAATRYNNIEDSAFKTKFLRSITGSLDDHLFFSKEQKCSLKKDPSLDSRYISEERSKMANPQLKEIRHFRQNLPVSSKREEILDTLDKYHVMLVTGETGCGKTTQVAQFILEDAIASENGSQTYIICTQPRRISAITVAERVAMERGERLGESVGYQIRLEKILPRPSASILFCTTGVLLQYMRSDPQLTKVSAVIVDEIHERNTVSDFVIAILRDIIPFRPDLKIILMSATLNADRFSTYFNSCPTVHIPGFTFEVTEYYLEDVLENSNFTFPPSSRKSATVSPQDQVVLQAFYRDLEKRGNYSRKTIDNLKNPESNEINCKLIVELIQYICREMGPGAILVFLPGWDKISAVNTALMKSGFRSSRYRIIPLHSMMPTTNQRHVFDRPPPGVRKILLATNIAETSITIDDVVYVIDCGKIKIKNFDVDGNVSTLKEEWVSLANAKQRRGRAGRVQKGFCFHLYSKGREMLLQVDMLPEMLRTRLEEVILQGKMLQVGKIGRFLQRVMDPPSERSVELSVGVLTAMNALDEDENLTPLGYHLATLPIDPQAGKMLLFASIFGTLDPITSVVATLSFKDPFIVPLGQEKEVDLIRSSIDMGDKSDHLISAKVMSNYEDARRSSKYHQFIDENHLSPTVLNQLKDMKRQFASLLYDMKYSANSRVNGVENNRNSFNMSVVRAVVVAALFPNVAVVTKVKRVGSKRLVTSVFTIDGQKVDFHPKSVFSSNDDYESKYVVYFEKLKSSKINLFDCTMSFPVSLMLFSHNLKIVNKGGYKLVEAGPNMVFRCSDQLAILVAQLRSWFDWLLEYKMCHPGPTDWRPESNEGVILKAAVDLITADEFSCSVDAV